MLSNEEQAAYLDSVERVRQSALNRLGSNGGGAVDFIANLHRGMDKVMLQGSELKCAAGCAWCCSVRVEATEPEIFLIARELRKHQSANIPALVERLQSFVAEADDAPARRDCALLEDNRCSIYNARPAVCRRAHSLSAESCKRYAPEIPQRLDLLLQAGALMQGTSEAYRHTGLHASTHELCHALMLALTDETTEARWLNGEAVFAG